METESLQVDVQRFPYAWITANNESYLGKTIDAKVAPEEIIEAHFFGGGDGTYKTELRYFRDENGYLRSFEVSADEKDCLLATYPVERAPHQTITVARVLDFDEDGQAYVKYTMLWDWGCG